MTEETEKELLGKVDCESLQKRHPRRGTTAERLNRRRFWQKLKRRFKITRREIPLNHPARPKPSRRLIPLRPRDVFIVIPPDDQGATAASFVGEAEESLSPREVVKRNWKIQKSFLRGTLSDRGWNGSLLRKNAFNSYQEDNIAVAASSKRCFSGTISSLSALNVLLVSNPSPGDLKAMSEAGATVLANSIVTLVDPVATDAKVKSQPTASGAWHLSHINIAAARRKGLNGKGIWVGVLDTGIDASHPEFAGKLPEFRKFSPAGLTVKDAPIGDSEKHGTHVCGLIAGKKYGIAPEADLRVAAVLTQKDKNNRPYASLGQILRGYNWLLSPVAGEKKIGVINASLSVISQDPRLYSLVEKARKEFKILTVAAIGNNGTLGEGNHTAPGNFDKVVGVGATDIDDQIADFSDWGDLRPMYEASKPDLCAPGVGVVSAVPGARYEAMHGTSMATPMVAAAAALLLQSDAELAENPDGLVERLFGLTSPLSDPKRGGLGRLDLTRI